MKIETIRHSISHIMASAVRDIFGDALPAGRQVKFGIGPTIENGFYYDFDLPPAAKSEPRLRREDLPKIEKKRMRELIKQNIKFEKVSLPKNKPRNYFPDSRINWN